MVKQPKQLQDTINLITILQYTIKQVNIVMNNHIWKNNTILPELLPCTLNKRHLTSQAMHI